MTGGDYGTEKCTANIRLLYGKRELLVSVPDRCDHHKRRQDAFCENAFR